MVLNMTKRDLSKYSWCETITSSGRYHIRRLSDKGRKVNGGADTISLCGLRPAWDITERYPVNESTIIATPHYGYPCRECVSNLNKIERNN